MENSDPYKTEHQNLFFYHFLKQFCVEYLFIQGSGNIRLDILTLFLWDGCCNLDYLILNLAGENVKFWPISLSFS